MCVPPFTHTHTHTNDLHKQVQQSQCMTSVLQWHTEKTWRKNWEINNRIERSIQNRWTMKNSMNTQWSECVNPITTFTFSRRFYPKQLTYVRLTMYTHFTFTLMAHCTSGAIRGSVSCSRTLRQGIELATFWLLNDFSTSCTTVATVIEHVLCAGSSSVH